MNDEFDISKNRILNTLLQTLNGERDLSPKGFVDTPVIDVLELINSHNDYVSTSSCSGRIALYEAVKDKGVQWLLVKHGPITIDEVQTSVLSSNIIVDDDNKSSDNNFLMLKCESFILHILCRDIHSAKLLLNIALECGYRESGITLGKGSRVMIAIRTTAFGLEVPIAIKSSSLATMLFTSEILSLVIKEANKKLLLNFNRIDNFLSKLKHCWGWPKVIISNENNNCRRWGHSCLQSCSDSSSIIIYGGYGVKETSNDSTNNDQNEKSTRKLNCVSFNTDKNNSTTILEETNSMHSVVVILQNNEANCPNTDSFYIVSGGRAAPSVPLPCLVILDKNFKTVATVEEGDVPSPRWGHSLTRFNPDTGIKNISYFLFGGRDADTVYGDAYILSCNFEVDTIRCVWTKLWEKNDMIPARVFHAAAGIPDNINNSDHDKNEHSNAKNDDEFIELILIHGGLLSLEDPVTDSSFVLIKPSSSKVNHVINESSTNIIVSKFAHTLTYVGKNALFLIGGTSFNHDDKNDDNNSTDCYRIDFVRSIDDDNDVSILCDIQPLNFSSSTHLPCAKCRCHHQAVYSSKARTLNLIGGGQLCLGFGAHYCQSLSLSITHNYEQNDTKESRHQSNINVKSNRKADDVADNSLVIFISSQMLKKIKTFLEHYNFFDKTRRISATESKNALIKETFAVPVKVDFLDSVRDGKLSQSAVSELASYIDSNKSASIIVPVDISNINKINDSIDNIILWYGFQSPFLNKTITTSGYRKAFEYLENSILTIPNIDQETASQLRGNLPKKFEFVGDIMMIPSDTFDCSEWELFLKHNSSAFWTGLAKCFGLSRIARKSKIDSGPKRESNVILLLPPCGQPSETGPSSAGWVTVTENSILQSFDITRVMFCSGNITEKMRMGKQECTGQTIVDLYCGIGYYTLPFLVHGNAAHVHACEWNSNSVMALIENLKNNKIHSSRYTIYENDNRITAPTLKDVADRVCLGLLPSSEEGWPLAAIALNPTTGGILHVHENVNDDKIEQFSEYLLKSLEMAFRKEGKYFNFKIIKTEKVKSYAPHVLHIVFDVLCLPI